MKYFACFGCQFTFINPTKVLVTILHVMYENKHSFVVIPNLRWPSAIIDFCTYEYYFALQFNVKNNNYF